MQTCNNVTDINLPLKAVPHLAITEGTLSSGKEREEGGNEDSVYRCRFVFLHFTAHRKETFAISKARGFRILCCYIVLLKRLLSVSFFLSVSSLLHCNFITGLSPIVGEINRMWIIDEDLIDQLLPKLNRAVRLLLILSVNKIDISSVSAQQREKLCFCCT